MRWFILAGATIALLPRPACAQLPFALPPPPGGLAVGYHTRHLNLYATVGRPFGGLYAPFFPPGPWGPPPPFGFGPPPFGFGPPPIVSATVVVPARPVLPPLGDLLPVNAEEPPRPIDPDRFIVIKPDRPNNVGRANPAPAALPARVEKKPKEVDLGIVPAELPLAPAPGNGRIEADRQLDRGKMVFARGEYGLALEHFRRATKRAADEAAAWFLLAQTQFAVGKYDEAAASVAEGMKRRPDWPASRFQSRDVYRVNPAAFDLHLQRLRDALAADPNDPRLSFLLGVELWFDDKRDEARGLFANAARLAKDPGPAEAFLRK